MIALKRIFSTLCDILVLLGLLGLIVPSYGFAKGKDGQQEIGNDRQDNGDDEDNSNHAGDGKDRIERCLRAFSQGKKPHKNCSSGGSSSGIAKADFNGDNAVTITDWSIFLFRWNAEDPSLKPKIDLDGNGKIDIADFSIFLKAMKI